MSQENVEVVRRSTAAYNRRDVDGILENWAPEAVVERLCHCEALVLPR